MKKRNLILPFLMVGLLAACASDPSSSSVSSSKTPESSQSSSQSGEVLIDEIILPEEMEIAITEEDGLEIEYEINPEDATEVIEWISDDEDIATVDEDGIVYPVAIGETTITAKTQNCEESFTLYVIEEEYTQVVNFYIDFWHSDTPIYTMNWYNGVPLGELPNEAKLDDSMATDPLFPHFIGYSEFSSSIDDSLLWDFATSYKIGNPLNLYGIWVG